MPLILDDTIVAIASPQGAAERGIVRVSGGPLTDVLQKLFVAAPNESNWLQATRPHRYPGHLELPKIGVPLACALMYWPTSRSYTAEPMAELHTIGSPPLLDAVLERLMECGARHASRGEFTMRAFLGGRIDLVQAEAVLGVIDATDHEELQAALSQLGGGITNTLAEVRKQILSLLGDLEAGLDFVEEDIEFISSVQICDRLNECRNRLHILAQASDERLPSGYRHRVVLAGAPNAGKSTLFNRLVGDSRAIVSPQAGTTRDYLSAPVRFGSVDTELIDTAGWEVAASLIMKQAQQLRANQVQSSDLVVWCVSADATPRERQQQHRMLESLESEELNVLEINTRCDLCDEDILQQRKGPRVSSHSSEDMTSLMAIIESSLIGNPNSRAELVSSTAARCRESLQRSIEVMWRAHDAAEQILGDEIVAMELRDTLHHIATILGEVYTDDILDHIFSNFCIGK